MVLLFFDGVGEGFGGYSQCCGQTLCAELIFQWALIKSASGTRWPCNQADASAKCKYACNDLSCMPMLDPERTSASSNLDGMCWGRLEAILLRLLQSSGITVMATKAKLPAMARSHS